MRRLRPILTNSGALHGQASDPTDRGRSAARAAQVVEAAIADYARVYPGPLPDPLGGA